MKRTRVNPRNPRTTAVKKLVSRRHDEVIERDSNKVFNGERISDFCFFHWTPIACNNRPDRVNEIIPRGRAVREAQAKFFVDENQCEIDWRCEELAQTKVGRKMLQDAMSRVWGYEYVSGFPIDFPDPKGVR